MDNSNGKHRMPPYAIMNQLDIMQQKSPFSVASLPHSPTSTFFFQGIKHPSNVPLTHGPPNQLDQRPFG
eukprot:4954308-Ditylum_brightwellii.AAC.1